MRASRDSIKSCIIIKRFRVTLSASGKREFVPRDQVFPISFCVLFVTSAQKLVVHASFIRKNCFKLALSMFFYFEKFSTWIWRLPFSVLPRILGRPVGVLTKILNSVCSKPVLARIKIHKDWEPNFCCSFGEQVTVFLLFFWALTRPTQMAAAFSKSKSSDFRCLELIDFGICAVVLGDWTSSTQFALTKVSFLLRSS